MTNEMIEQYYKNLIKFQNDEWTSDMWYAYCASVLCELMEEHKDVFVRLKNR